MATIPVVICGGGGARLWPVSRQSYPKPFMRLPDGASLIQHALRHALAIPGGGEIVTVSNRELVFEIRDHYAQAGGGERRHRFILEPEGRDTAAAIAVAALEIAETHGRDAMICTLPSDHLIHDIGAFAAAAGEAMALAAGSRLVTLGMRPDEPATCFGYIEADGSRIERFIEKPDVGTAAALIAGGRALWNSGMYFCQAGTMIDLMEQNCPDILVACRDSLARARRLAVAGMAQVELPQEEFAKVRAQSVDYAVMEKAAGLGVIACDIGWRDVGSWSALARLTAADGQGNALVGPVTAIDTNNSFVRGSDRLIATLGIENLVIIDTPDALLVAAANRTQDVRQLPARLKAEGNGAWREHTKVHRPWGTYTVLETGPRFKIKRIEVKPGARLSLQAHQHRSEHWVVVAGRAHVINGDEDLILLPDQSAFIPCGRKHRVGNPDTEPLVLIEVQTGEYLGEDDILRFEDIYGR